MIDTSLATLHCRCHFLAELLGFPRVYCVLLSTVLSCALCTVSYVFLYSGTCQALQRGWRGNFVAGPCRRQQCFIRWHKEHKSLFLKLLTSGFQMETKWSHSLFVRGNMYRNTKSNNMNSPCSICLLCFESWLEVLIDAFLNTLLKCEDTGVLCDWMLHLKRSTGS